MARISYQQMLYNRRLETFVRSPRWEYFDGGRWRRYRKVRIVSQRTPDRSYRAGYADAHGSYNWTGTTFYWEDDACRALFPLIEAYADARDAEEKAARLAAYDPSDFADMPEAPPEDWSDWVDEKVEYHPEDFPKESPMSDEERADWAEIWRQEKEDAKLLAEDWVLHLPEDFPALPEDEPDPYDGY